MNVMLGADSLVLPRSGIGRMTAEIGHAVRDLPEVDDLLLLMNGRVRDASMLDAPPEIGTAPAGPSLSAAARHLARLPLARTLRDAVVRRGIERAAAGMTARNGAPVVYHEPNMIAKPFRGVTVTGINDLSWRQHPESHPADRIAWIARRLDRTIRQSARFTALSTFTRDGMVAELGIERARIDVVPLAPSALFRLVTAAEAAPVLASHGLRDRGYILSVSTIEPRKNFDRLLGAWLRLPARQRAAFPLAVVGGQGWGTVLASPAAAQAQAARSLLLLGYVPDAALAALYARCALMAYVSLYEGFGLPILEAMASGAPVVSSRTTGCGEVAGAAASLVDPADTDAIAGAMAELLEDGAQADALRAAGLVHAAGYTWPHTAALMAASWRRALG